MPRVLICLVFLLTSSTTWAKSDTEHNQEAMKKTQELLKDPTQRQKALDNPAAKQSADRVQQLTGGDAQMEQAIWEMSAELMPLLVEEANGDPKKMAEYLEKMKSNPQAFADRFPAAQKKKLQEIADKIAKKQQQKP